jgi:uncharacterized protein YjbJ (UPF0337 family)
MTNNPEDIRRDIEQTRRDLSDDVNALQEKVSPARVVERRVHRARGAATSVRERVMGSATSASDKASAVPQMARQQTQGNPLAAGVVAFGAGWLISSILPASTKERELAGGIKDKAVENAGPVKEKMSEVAGELKENLRGPAQEAVASVKGSAGDAASTVKDEAASAKDDVTAGNNQAQTSGTPQSGTGSSYLR